ncbi:MAG: STAS domain-containing protein [Nitrospirota bacterium]|jgi:anti-anti-sigma factor|nr:STAS domain-containing protein [Nitrospirota bacterium]MDH4360291.1 STAS domain-containing protein [Nitrospirota bacterium]MDH5295618.1 STAS domain-containing protein [Nitrospirota bacterium]MDH5576293.1 STAS domain-containing protein [Nitrospirota bacterium]
MEQPQSTSTAEENSILSPMGDLTIFESAQFHADLVALHQQKGPLQLDLTGVNHMDSSCVQLVVAATRSGRLTLHGYSAGIRDKFEQIGFAQFLPNYELSCRTNNKHGMCFTR